LIRALEQRETQLMNANADLVSTFRDQLRPGRVELFDVIHQAISIAAPALAVERTGKMLGYGPFHYRYSSGREGDAHAIGISDGAQALSIYIVAVDNGAYLAESFRDRLGKVSVGKSCIRVKKLGDLDLDVFAEVVTETARRHQAGTLLIA
jgi:hypothetical protein